MVNKRKLIEIELPKGFMNVGITTSNYLIADTNDSGNWDTLKFPLPKGEWEIYKYTGDSNKDVILIDVSSK